MSQSIETQEPQAKKARKDDQTNDEASASCSEINSDHPVAVDYSNEFTTTQAAHELLHNEKNEFLKSHGQKSEPSAENFADKNVNIYIWDMDETLILLKSLLDGTYAVAFNGMKDTQRGIRIGRHWENLILEVCDEFFFYRQTEDYNEPFLDSLSKFDDGKDLSDYDFSNDGFGLPNDDQNRKKLAYRHRAIAQKYAQGLHNVIDQEMVKLWSNLYELTDAFTDRWLSSARAFLEQSSIGNKVSTPLHLSPGSATNSTDMKCKIVNVLVTSGSLIPSLVKCLLFRLDDFISHENVYSSSEVGKLQCFKWINERFNAPTAKFCVIGDGTEECEAAQSMNWPFIQMDLRPNGTNRFPGLMKKTVDLYLDVLYGDMATENNEE